MTPVIRPSLNADVEAVQYADIAVIGDVNLA